MLYGQFKYSKRHKSAKPEWRVLDYLEDMRDWSDPKDSAIYKDTVLFYVRVLNGNSSFMRVVEEGYKELGIELRT